MKDFDLKKYIEYQELLFKEFKDKKLNAQEFSNKSCYHLEYVELLKKVDSIKEWIKEYNLPFTINCCDFNIQTLYNTNNILIERLKNFNDFS